MEKARPVIQVAGVIDQAEATLLGAAGVDWLGFPFHLSVHAEDLPRAQAARIIAALPRSIRALAITYLTEPAPIIALCRELGVSAVQLHAPVARDDLVALRQAWPGLRLIRSLVVGEQGAAPCLREIATSADWVDAYITDTHDPVTGATGATGKTHDWRVSRALVRASAKPVILAGGLTPDNVADAIARVRPAGVDVHTGVEGPDGRKDAALVQRFVAEARRAFAALRPPG